MYYSQSIIGNSRLGQEQWRNIILQRELANNNEIQLNRLNQEILIANGFAVNDGRIPQDVYREFDNVTVEEMRLDEGDTFLNDLMPLSRPINIGKLTYEYRRASSSGIAKTSISGQQGVLMENVAFSYDGSPVPIHDTGFYRSWRELAGMRSEQFDALIDDQRESVRTLRNHLADNFLDGHVDDNGNTITVDGRSWAGMRNDTRVEQIDLGAGGINFNFTDSAQTGEAIKNAFIQVLDVMRITNKCSRDMTIYVSEEIASNFERKYSAQYNAPTIVQELGTLRRVATIKVTSKLSGNQMMGFPLDRSIIQPLMGMGISTMAMPRPMYNSDYKFVVAGAIGFIVKEDYAGNTCCFYASA